MRGFFPPSVNTLSAGKVTLFIGYGWPWGIMSFIISRVIVRVISSIIIVIIPISIWMPSVDPGIIPSPVMVRVPIPISNSYSTRWTIWPAPIPVPINPVVRIVTSVEIVIVNSLIALASFLSFSFFSDVFFLLGVRAANTTDLSIASEY